MPTILSRLRGLVAPSTPDQPLRLADAGGVTPSSGGSGQTIIISRDKGARREPHRPPGGTPAAASGATPSAGPTILIARNMRDARRQANRAPGSLFVIPASGVTPGTYNTANITVGADGRVTGAANGTVLATAAPGLIPDLSLWWESDDISGASGAAITRLRERTPWIGGLAAAASSNVGGLVAIDSTLLNGLPVLKWPAASVAGLYAIPYPSGTTAANATGIYFTAGATYFIVAKGSTATGTQAITGGSSGALSLYLVSVSGTAKIGLVKTAAAVIGSSSTAWTAGTAFQANVTYNPTTGAFVFRQGRASAGSGTGTTGGGGAAQPTNLLGGDTGNSSLLNAASLGLLIAYNRILTSTEITNVETYIFNKWGV
jgi:hypothetical protein